MEVKKIPNNLNISKLDLSNSNLKEVPHEIFKLKNLRTLNLSGNLIKDIPKEISELKKLEVLDISNNKISNFFAKLCELRKLHTLNLNNNQIKTVPRQVLKLQHLRKIFLAGNKLKTLPDEFSKLNSLVSINLSKNLFSELPEPLMALVNLKHLWICQLPLKNAMLSTLYVNLKNLQGIYAYSPILDRTMLDHNYLALTIIKGNSLRTFQQIGDTNDISRLINSLPLIKNDKNKTIPVNMNKTSKTSIFISYSHKDKIWLEKVQTHIKVLKHQTEFDFEVWDDNKIAAGDKWKDEITKALNRAKVAILIVSTDFLASDFIQGKEIPELLNNANENGTILLSIIVRPCRFSNQIGISDLQAVNAPSEALSGLSEHEQEKVLLKLTERIEQLIQ
ncbi:leucine-rich repeat domain-containing protein [Flavobacterium hydatis]|uniref:TIR domain-containing protein n=1 Tax=Flavobacterium hydatis TaxID=991 RepID=A0ABX4CH18_FLAHY|nr:leucine-rich repeat domain-containing protein [Flavobacterium hydatis]OXA93666.1 hypothetical protein B0A62_13015 [Flavobacterium hydatis]